MSNRLHLPLFVLVWGTGCSSTPSTPARPSFDIGDDYALSGPLAVTGFVEPPPTTGWSVVEWPEMTDVPVVVGAPQETPGEREVDTWTLPITPESAFEERWYAVRWTRNPEDEVIEGAVPVVNGRYLAGLPLSDGTYIGRFYGAAYPELTVLYGWDSATAPRVLEARFSMQVFLAEGYSLEQAMRVSQGAAVCAPYFAGEPGLFVDSFSVLCDPPLDWEEPVFVEIPGFVSSGGLPVIAPRTEYTFPEDITGGGLRGVSVPRTLIPPPVPAALCAGRACAP